MIVIDGGPSSSRTNGDNNVSERTPLLQKDEEEIMPAEKNIGISQQTLVSTTSEDVLPEGRKLPQYIAGLSSTLGALAAGMVLAWSSSAGNDGVELAKEYNMDISTAEFSWIASIVNLGAATICVPIGVLCDLIGRKPAMLVLTVPFIVGWCLIIWADSVLLFLIGRYITGLSGGAFCVTAPMYAAEIAESSIRGSLGSYFQLLLTAGILLSYVIGPYSKMFVLSIISALIPLIFCGVFFFMPETPIYYLKKGNEDGARQSLIRLRGPDYNVEPELRAQKESLAEAERNKVSFLVAVKSKAAKRGIVIAFGLMFFQQLSGVNAVIFFVSQIFQDAGADLEPSLSAIIVGVMQVLAVFVSTLIVDRLGRKLLLLVSSVAMFVTTLVLGVFFYMKEHEQDVSSIGMIPLVSVCLFIILFSLGFGPIPWMMIGEIFSPQIKGVVGSSACLFNWLMAFIVTKTFSDLKEAMGSGGTFWLFSAICLGAIIFVFFVVPETKGKSLDQIQAELGGDSSVKT